MSKGRARAKTERREVASNLRALGDAVVATARANEFLALKDGLAPLYDALALAGYPVDFDLLKTATRQLLEGASESAILGLIPSDATVSGVRIGTGVVTATVALEGRRGYQTETAGTLALGWFFAFAHALADLLEE